MANKLLILICAILLLSTCKKRKDPIYWNADYIIPLAYGSLSIIDLLTDTLTSVNTDQSVNLSYNSTLYKLDLDSLISIPSATLSDTFALPFPVAVSFNPGQTFINQAEEQNINLNSSELTEISLLSAKLFYTIQSTIEGEVIYEYQINSATDPLGNIFKHEVVVPPALPGQPSIVNGNINISNYTWDLRGLSGNTTNTILTTVNVKVSDNNSTSISVSNLDTLFINNQIDSLQLTSARGYFGQETTATGIETTPISLFEIIKAGTVDLNQITANLNIINGIGVDAQIEINNLYVADPISGNPISIGHPIIGQPQNINRAYENNSTIISTNYSTTFDQGNSNIESMLEALPNEIGYDINLAINPLGNVSGHNDFIHKDHPFLIDLDLLVPLELITNNLTLQDTIDININDTSGINYGKLYFDITNGFPFQAQIMLAIPSSNNNLFSPDIIYSATIDNNGIVTEPRNSLHTIELSTADVEQLKINKKIILTIVFNTADPTSHLTIYDDYKIDFKISGDFNATITIP